MISDEAVEAAFRSMWGPNPSNPSDSGDAHLLKELRKALGAAAPHMLADAWDDAFDKGCERGEWEAAPVTKEPRYTNPHRRQA